MSSIKIASTPTNIKLTLALSCPNYKIATWLKNRINYYPPKVGTKDRFLWPVLWGGLAIIRNKALFLDSLLDIVLGK